MYMLCEWQCHTTKGDGPPDFIQTGMYQNPKRYASAHLSHVLSKVQVLLKAASSQIKAGQVHASLCQGIQLLHELPGLALPRLQGPNCPTHWAAAHACLHMQTQLL